MTLIPDAIEPVTGFRFWRVIDNELHSYNSNGGSWEPGENEAVCWNLDNGLRRVRKNNPDGTVGIVEHDTHDRIPADSCKCGFWLLKDARHAVREAGNPMRSLAFAFSNALSSSLMVGGHSSDSRLQLVVGKVEGYGRVIVAEHGYRCEKSRIVGLLDIDRPLLLRGDDLAAVAEAYGVPVVRREELDASDRPRPRAPIGMSRQELTGMSRQEYERYLQVAGFTPEITYSIDDSSTSRPSWKTSLLVGAGCAVIAGLVGLIVETVWS